MKHWSRVILFFLFTLFYNINAQQEPYIVIPGTWSKFARWYKPSSFFYDILSLSAHYQGKSVCTFAWSGRLNHEERSAAALRLAQFIQKHPSDTVHIIAHSHGANVGIMAAQELKRIHSHKRIGTFFALGAPVDKKQYKPTMEIIEYLYNLYSYADIIQPIFGQYQRHFESHERIANIRVLIDNFQPFHSSLHHPLIARWIPLIHDFVIKETHSFKQFDFSQNGIIEFSTENSPVYKIDNEPTLMPPIRSSRERYPVFRKKIV